MYASKNFKTKKMFREAVRKGEQITLWAPGLGSPNVNGYEFVEGPWAPQPHKWYAKVTMLNGVVIAVN